MDLSLWEIILEDEEEEKKREGEVLEDEEEEKREDEVQARAGQGERLVSFLKLVAIKQFFSSEPPTKLHIYLE